LKKFGPAILPTLLGPCSACVEAWRALLDDEVQNRVSSRAEQEAKMLLKGTEKEEMARLLDSNSELSWEERVAQYPRANDKFQALWSKAKSDLNFDLSQARVIRSNLNTIERIEALITSAQRRIDEVVRELDRHRVIRVQLNKFNNGTDRIKAAPPKMITGKVVDKKVA
jgi:predicted RNase H-like nuclease (RuvC/YqgF family)